MHGCCACTLPAGHHDLPSPATMCSQVMMKQPSSARLLVALLLAALAPPACLAIRPINDPRDTQALFYDVSTSKKKALDTAEQ